MSRRGVHAEARVAVANPAPEPSRPEPIGPEGERLMRAIMESPLEGAARSERRRVRCGTSGAVALAALAVAAGALAAGQLGIGDLPPFGDDDRAAFVLPRSELLPGGYARERPPRIDEVPPRPSLLFPRGVTYARAVASYFTARTRGQRLPPGVHLSTPLPAGKAVLVEDGRVALDPAAPVGYEPGTGYVRTLERAPLSAERIPRCQLLLGREDRRSSACPLEPGPIPYVREGVAGRWIPSGLIDPTDFGGAFAGSTELSVLERPRGRKDASPPSVSWVGPLGLRQLPSQARLALARSRVRLWVLPASDDYLCFVLQEGVSERASGTCGPRGTLLRRGLVELATGVRATGLYAGLVGDGVARVTTGGVSVPVKNNVFLMRRSQVGRYLEMSGPVGRYRVRLPGPGDFTRSRPISAREREVLSIALSAGGRASVRVAPNRGGGWCFRVSVREATRVRGCPPPGSLTLDDVSGDFHLPGRGRPEVYAAQVRPEVGFLEMRFRDGARARLTPRRGFVLYELPPGRARPAREPVAVTSFDRRGVALFRRDLIEFARLLRGRP